VNGAHVVRAILNSRWVENPMMGWGNGGGIETRRRSFGRSNQLPEHVGNGNEFLY